MEWVPYASIYVRVLVCVCVTFYAKCLGVIALNAWRPSWLEVVGVLFIVCEVLSNLCAMISPSGPDKPVSKTDFLCPLSKKPLLSMTAWRA